MTGVQTCALPICAVDSKHIHKQSLLDNEMLAGVHIKTHIFNTPNLTDGSVYSISISGKDRAGNESNISIARDRKSVV